MNKEDLRKFSEELIDTFLIAGNRSVELRNQGLKKEIKKDNTPVTNGDIEVNNILTEKIKSLTPEIPIVSEESSLNKNNIELENFWLIDPIDGTYDYINNKDEFTINAALILGRKPALGIINAPAKKRVFYSYGLGDCYEIIGKEHKKLGCKKISKKGSVNALSYSEKLKPIIYDIHKKLKVTSFNKVKSSLKFCLIATGEYDLYVTEPRAQEWDIAAGHAIIDGAGGKITDFEGKEILYGKKEFKNPSLIAKRIGEL
tara:strand:+ start:2083 stop:2856 length:774 start_codon:yes stop_codon:yes gene_type:complete